MKKLFLTLAILAAAVLGIFIYRKIEEDKVYRT